MNVPDDKERIVLRSEFEPVRWICVGGAGCFDLSRRAFGFAGLLSSVRAEEVVKTSNHSRSRLWMAVAATTAMPHSDTDLIKALGDISSQSV